MVKWNENEARSKKIKGQKKVALKQVLSFFLFHFSVICLAYSFSLGILILNVFNLALE